ncbi:hypothetical protein AB0M38_21045 [Streptomyces sp. NPDC051742]|uniref:hypothetical protein n=1 Tax=unclassified Streptomyces TaxID=2593676 RepID=UPI003415AD73
MRYRLRVAVAMTAAVLTGCSGGSGGRPSAVPPSSSASPSSSPSPSPPQQVTREEVAERTRTAVLKSTARLPDAPGPDGPMLVEAWASGEAAWVWETGDHRLCHASVAGDTVFQRACATNPNDPPVSKGRQIRSLDTLFTHGWGRVFAADHQEVTAAFCSGRPVKVLRIGTVAKGTRTLYAVFFPDYTKGEVLLTLRHGTTTSRAPFLLGEAGDLSCTATSAARA